MRALTKEILNRVMPEHDKKGKIILYYISYLFLILIGILYGETKLYMKL
jgi:hypothetical protein